MSYENQKNWFYFWALYGVRGRSDWKVKGLRSNVNFSFCGYEKPVRFTSVIMQKQAWVRQQRRDVVDHGVLHPALLPILLLYLFTQDERAHGTESYRSSSRFSYKCVRKSEYKTRVSKTLPVLGEQNMETWFAELPFSFKIFQSALQRYFFWSKMLRACVCDYMRAPGHPALSQDKTIEHYN